MKKITFALITFVVSQQSFAQAILPAPSGYVRNKVITTGVPYLGISVDARSAGMGDMGVATSQDVYSQQYNAAKYVFAERSQGAGVSYTPYLSKISNDISLASINYFNKLNDRSAVATSLRHFSLGEVNLTGLDGSATGTYSPNEFAIDGTYALKLSETFASAVTARYINSNLQLGTESQGAATSFAVDLSGFYQSDKFSSGDSDGVIRAGFAVQNLGPKISYKDDESAGDFLPTNLRLGMGYDLILDQYNKVSFVGEFNKLMVPTPQEPIWIDKNNDGQLDVNEQRDAINQVGNRYSDTGWFKGAFTSFGDAPGGFSEEMQELNWALGAEYWYDDSFAFRGGYFHEPEEKGSRQFATIGAGFKYNTINIDVSYLFSMGDIQSPLDSTLRFSMAFNFGSKYRKR